MDIYHYTWGDVDILGSSLRIIRNDIDDNSLASIIDTNKTHTIIFEQEGFNPSLFDDIQIVYGEVISKTISDIHDDEGIVKRIITIEIMAICNPRPERLFKLVPPKAIKSD